MYFWQATQYDTNRECFTGIPFFFGCKTVYHTIGLEQTRDTRLRIASQLEVYQMLANRLDTYLCALYPEDAAVLKKHYFDGLSWQGIADAEQHCIRTVIKRRNRGMKRLTELYDRLARLGALPGVEPSM